LRFWMVFGRFWGGFGGSKIIDFLDCVFAFRTLVAGAFGRGFDQRVRKNTNKYEGIRKSTEKYQKIL